MKLHKQLCLALSLSLFSHHPVQSQQCGLIGQCQGNTLLPGFFSSKSDCIQFCKDTTDCEWYSYDFQDNFCLTLTNCTSLDDCATCVSGEVSCEAYTCFVPGGCQGSILGHQDLPDQTECLNACKAMSGCDWFTYFIDTAVCALYSTCQVTEAICERCVSGERECGDGGSGLSELKIGVRAYTLLS